MTNCFSTIKIGLVALIFSNFFIFFDAQAGLRSFFKKVFHSDSNHSEYSYSSRSRGGGFPSYIKPQGERVFIFSPKKLRWAAYSANGRLIESGKASGGAGFCPDVGRRCKTPIGSFRVGRKGSPSCVSSKYPVGRGGAPMPYCMFFYKGYAIHGSPSVPNYNSSHGCIRVKNWAARWLSQSFIRPGTKVIVWPY